MNHRHRPLPFLKCFSLFLLAWGAAPSLPAADSGSSAVDVRSTLAEWPAGVQEIAIGGAADGEAQRAIYYVPPGEGEPHPLLVFLHPWSGNYTYKTGIGMAEGAIRNGWAYVQPDFHGPNNRPQALGSDLVIADIANAVAYAKEHGKIDPRRVYLAGASGGGHAALLAVGRLPGLFTAVSSWVPITDLVAWHAQCLGGKHANYAHDIETACGGAPLPGSPAEAEARKRSPLTHLPQAGPIRVDINTGIHDGHGENSVPVSHSLRAFNLLAAPGDRVADDDIRRMVEEEAVPEALRFSGTDVSYAPRAVLFRRSSGGVRVTVTDGKHEIVVPAALAWLASVDKEVAAQPPTTTTDATTGIPFPLLGRVAPRSARGIASSSWSVGGETLDRGFASYDAYKSYLGPLGAKAIRLQAGWAKTESQKGAYDWAWLDAIVDDARAQGLAPWLQLSYGNPLYEGGGTPAIFSPLPSSDEALRAWDAWVRAAVRRYKDRVGAWEIWNEPDLAGDASLAEAYAPFFVRTAQIIREEAPQGRIYALAVAKTPAYAGKFLDLVAAQGKLNLVDAITFHHYPENPDDLSVYEGVKQAAENRDRPIELREGESGAPSGETTGALSKFAWSPLTQAKWDLRRMLAFHGNGIAFNLFTMSDFLYPKGMNRKGLLEARPDHSIVGPKPAYRAAQAVFALFDDTVKVQNGVEVKTPAEASLAAYVYAKDGTGATLVTLWEKGAPVIETNTLHETDLEIPGARFDDPVYVDLLSARVFQVPRENWSAEAGTVRFRKIPLYDSPIVLADRSAVPLAPAP